MLSWLWWPSEGTPWSSIYWNTLAHDSFRSSLFILHSSRWIRLPFWHLSSGQKFVFFVLFWLKSNVSNHFILNARTSRHCCAFSHAMYSQYLPSPFTFRSRVCESIFIFLCSSLGKKIEMDPRVFGLRKLIIRYALNNIAYVYVTSVVSELLLSLARLLIMN